MVFLIILGGLFLILGGFYLANSWQQYREWKTGTIIVVLSVIAIAFGIIKLPVFNHQSSQSGSKSSSAQVASGNNSLSFSNKSGMNGQDQNSAVQENKAMAVLRELQKGYSKFGTVDYSAKSKTFKITPTNDDTVEALKALAQDPSQAEQMGWSNLTKSIMTNSKDISKVLGEGYSISIMNPGDDSQTMYKATDGRTTYDIADQ